MPCHGCRAKTFIPSIIAAALSITAAQMLAASSQSKFPYLVFTNRCHRLDGEKGVKVTDTPIWLQTDLLLAERTTMRVGGRARFWCEPKDVPSLSRALHWAEEQGLPTFVLGGGSNVVFPDRGFDGLVIHLAMYGYETETVDGRIHLTAQAGENWDDLVAWATARNLAGIECLAGIPGKVGAAPIQNIGAYGQELADCLVAVHCYDRQLHTAVRLDRAACHFRYRDSIFKSEARGRFIVLAITLGLEQDGMPTIAYDDLRQRLPSAATLQQVRQTVLDVRRKKSMVVDPADVNSHGCGSFFTNPILDEAAFRALRARCDQAPKHWPVGEHHFKVPAAWLIEQAGFSKGYRQGRAGLSEKHCLAITNRGGATAAEVVTLAQSVQRGVLDRFGVQLIPEPVIVDAEADLRP